MRMKHIVVDLEMNPIGKEYKEIRRKLNGEIIEIGAVRLSEKFVQEDKFQCYVCPEYGLVKKHITELTGITQEKVSGQRVFAESFKNFVDWIGASETKIYSWSMSDIKQLRKECRLKVPDFDVNWLDMRWVDLQQAFDDRLGLHNSLALKHALGAMGRRFEGTQHSALADAINTSAVLTLMQDDEKFRETMRPVLEILEPSEGLSDAIGDLFPDLEKLKNNL
ncbi:exonuclease [Selenomonas artemidis F0399]|uniref:Exonuclease n=2 Tax=Selenomonas TaxID=970 RepID=E7N1L5_9FIRM|nr:exonuclease [Selenomonas artemidis F0399]